MKALPRSALAHGTVSLAAIAVFARALPYPLQRSWDDGRFIIDDPLAHAISLPNLRAIFEGPHFEAYHPLHLIGYWLDVPFAGPHPFTLHAVSLLLWVLALNVWLRVFTALGLSLAAAVIATLAFGLHPVQVEAVSWASGRKDVLALLFAGGAFALHLRATPDRRRFRWLAAGAFVLAALAKTTVLPLPAVLVLADVWLRGQRLRAALAAQWLGFVVALGLGAGVVSIWSDNEMIRATSGGLLQLPARVASTLQHQLATALWPSANAPMYSTDTVAAATPLAWLLLALLIGLCFVLHSRGARRELFAVVAFCVWMVPVSNLVPMYFPYQDRYLSLPLTALGFGLGALVDRARASAGGAWPVAAASLLVAALGLRCVQYQGQWASEPQLWGHAASTQRDAYYAWLKLGEVRRRAGDLYGAIRAYQEVLHVDPRRKLGHAALLATAAERDERLRGLEARRADRYAEEYFAALEDAPALRALARRMLANGYVRAFELPLARSLALQALPDSALERAAEEHFNAGRDSVGWFFLRHMQQPTTRADLRAAGERARARQAQSPL